MKVLLTGAAGFVGSPVARELVRGGHDVTAVTRGTTTLWRLEDLRDSIQLIQGDLLDPSFVPPPSRFDGCIHLAWYVEPGKYLQSPLNKDWVEASLRLAKNLREAGCRRFVATGTCFEYAPSQPPQDESTPTQLTTPYVQAKLELFERLQSLEMETAWVRLFYQYGPQEDARRLVPVVINNLLRGEAMKLVPGERTRDFLHIEDVAGAMCAIATSQLTGAVNIGSGVPTTVKELALTIGGMLNRTELLQIGALPYSPTEPMDLLADNRKLREGTGWKMRYSLDEGLRQTVDWWKNRQAAT